MAVPSSGQLRLYADIGVELGVTQSNVSLGAMSDDAGFSEPDSMSDFYGYVDAIAPSVTTNNSSNATYNSFVANGNVTSDGGATITERGFYFGTSTNIASATKYVVSGTTGSFSRTFSGLSSSTTYRVWAYAKNSVGETIGARKDIATSYNYQLVGLSIDSNFQQSGGAVSSYYVQSYYQALNGSYVLDNTQYDSYAFLKTGANGRGYAKGSLIRNNRLNVYCDGGNGYTYSSQVVFNSNNGYVSANANATFANANFVSRVDGIGSGTVYWGIQNAGGIWRLYLDRYWGLGNGLQMSYDITNW